jgi:hypothetical protein
MTRLSVELLTDITLVSGKRNEISLSHAKRATTTGVFQYVEESLSYTR